MSIIEFLNARLDEDEAIAREAIPETVRGYGDESRRYVMRFDPDRILAEVAAKRMIIEMADAPRRNAEAIKKHLDRDGRVMSLGMEAAMKEVLKVIALPYADRPDYDKSWSLR